MRLDVLPMSTEYRPAPHSVQDVEPLVFAKVPEGQSVHLNTPLVELPLVPSLQGWHSAKVSFVIKFPGPQSLGGDEKPRQYDPGGQGSVAPVVLQ